MEKLSKNLMNAVLLIAAMFIYSSCNDELDQFDEEVENKIEKETIVDGRMKFNSSESLKSRIEDLKSQPESILVDELEKLNNAGFISLRPVVTEENLESVQARYGVMTNGRSIDEAQEVTDYIGDDVFAAILNEEGLLQVGDSIYKYTPIGLFFVHESKLDHLNNFLEELLGSQSNGRSLQPVDPCPILSPFSIQGGEVTSLDSDINYYSAINPCSYPSPSPTPSPNPSPSPSPTTDPAQDFINSLTPCDTNPGWANWLFGDSKICIDQFTDRSRIRTKVWNQNYQVYRSVGSKVKHQFKQFGIWYSSKIDELRVGIRSAYYEYSLPTYAVGNSVTNHLIYEGQVYSNLQINSPSQNFINPYLAPMPDGYDIDEDVDINFFVTLPGSNSDQVNEDYIKNEIWPDVELVIKQFCDYKNIAYDDLGGVQISVGGLDKVGYLTKNLHLKENNSKELEKVFRTDSNFYIKSKNDKITQIIFKNKNTFKTASFEVYGIGRRNTDFAGSLLYAYDLKPISW